MLSTKKIFFEPSTVELRLGHLGILLNKNAQEILSVGFGSGESSKCMSLHDHKNIDVIEISPELVKMSLKYFNHLNVVDQLDQKINMVYMDAKNYIHLTPKTYDVMVTDAINPCKFAENASLYTQEYFNNASHHLKPGGIIGCWLPIEEISISCIYSILKTFLSEFTYVTVWCSLQLPIPMTVFICWAQTLPSPIRRSI